jgi:hypothetical protein
MGRMSTAIAAAAWLAALPAAAQEREPGFADAVLGRWNLAIEEPAGSYPSWFEIRLRTERELMGRFVGRVGSARYASSITHAAGRLELRVPVQYESGIEELRFEGAVRGDRIEGTALGESGEALRFTAVRAPLLPAAAVREWGAPQAIGGSPEAWAPRDRGRERCWEWRGGVLSIAAACTDLVTNATYGDFRLHAEFRYPPGSNSGIYLRGRYEVQIQDDAGKALDSLRMGGIYGFIAPSVDAARHAGEWQTLDVELVGRRVTVALNGTTIVAGQEIPGITGGALDSDEARPGPLMLQGDHGAIEFRNLSVAEPLVYGSGSSDVR